VLVSITCLFPVLSRLPHLGIEKKACQYRVLIYVRFELLCSPFARVIAGSYEKGTAAHHCELEMYVCSLCNQSISTQGSLKRHWEPVHCQSTGFPYQVCSQRFYRKDVLQRYMKVHQPAVDVRQALLGCSTDTMVDLPLPSPLKKHRETPVCNLCTKTLTTQKTLKTSTDLSCQVCKPRFY